MILNRIRLSKEATNRLRWLAGKTGLTPNLLCRIGFCLSLGEPMMPKPEIYPEEDREFNRYTLLGQDDSFFFALLRQRCSRDRIEEEKIPDLFRAHLNRGIILLQKRIRSLNDIALLVVGKNAQQVPPSVG